MKLIGQGKNMLNEFDLMLLGILAIVVFTVGPHFENLKRKFSEGQKKRHVAKIIRKLQAAGVRFRFNMKDGVGAIALEEVFLEAYIKVASVVEPWDKVIVKVNPTYTVTLRPEAYRRIHTMQLYELDKILDRIISHVTHVNPGKLTRRQRSQVIDAILIRETQLFVPYSEGGPKAKEQIEKCGIPNVEEARAAMLKHVLSKHFV